MGGRERHGGARRLCLDPMTMTEGSVEGQRGGFACDRRSAAGSAYSAAMRGGRHLRGDCTIIAAELVREVMRVWR